MNSRRPPLFRKRQFEPVIIVTCVRWYLRYLLSTRDVEALIAERGLSVDHTTVVAVGPAIWPGTEPANVLHLWVTE